MSANHFKHSLNDIQNATGMKYSLIRKLIKKLPEYFDPEKSRGLSNAIFITDNGFTLFEQISEMKKQGKSQIQEIKTELKRLYVPIKTENVQTVNPVQTNIQTENNNETYSELIESLRETISILKADKDRILSLEEPASERLKREENTKLRYKYLSEIKAIQSSFWLRATSGNKLQDLCEKLSDVS